MVSRLDIVGGGNMQYDYLIVGADREITGSELTPEHVVKKGALWQKDMQVSGTAEPL
jgi:hypothetical protein